MELCFGAFFIRVTDPDYKGVDYAGVDYKVVDYKGVDYQGWTTAVRRMQKTPAARGAGQGFCMHWLESLSSRKQDASGFVFGPVE